MLLFDADVDPLVLLEKLKNLLVLHNIFYKNAKIMAEEFINKGYKVCTNGTDNHLILIDLNPQKITGSKIEKICEYVDIL